MIYAVKFVDILADLGGIQDLILVPRVGTVEVEASYIILPVVVKDQNVYAAPLSDHLRILIDRHPLIPAA